MNFYRYNIVHYASMNDYEGVSRRFDFPNPSVVLTTYDLIKETPKGHWISLGGLYETGKRWVSKTSKKRFAYPTKKEALMSFIKRQKSKIRILEHQITSSKLSLGIAERKLEKESVEYKSNKKR